MNLIVRGAKLYWRANKRAWLALRSFDPLWQVATIAAIYVAVSMGMRASGHADAALVLNLVAAVGLPLMGVAAGSARRR